MSMTAAPATISAHGYPSWEPMGKPMCASTAPGRTSGQTSPMNRRSPRPSKRAPPRNTPWPPPECTNLMWTDLGGGRGPAAGVDTSLARPDANRCHAHRSQTPGVSLPSRITLCSEMPPVNDTVGSRLPSGPAVAVRLQVRVAERIPSGAGSQYDAGRTRERDQGVARRPEHPDGSSSRRGG
jgi:hypothetical protein